MMTFGLSTGNIVTNQSNQNCNQLFIIEKVHHFNCVSSADCKAWMTMLAIHGANPIQPLYQSKEELFGTDLNDLLQLDEWNEEVTQYIEKKSSSSKGLFKSEIGLSEFIEEMEVCLCRLTKYENDLIVFNREVKEDLERLFYQPSCLSMTRRRRVTSLDCAS